MGPIRLLARLRAYRRRAGFRSRVRERFDERRSPVAALEDRLLLSGTGWLTTSSVQGSDPPTDLAQDVAGNTYVTGFFNGTMTFGSVTLVSDGGNPDLFVAKLDPAGNVAWARRFGGPGAEYSGDIAVSDDGFLYVAATFSGTTSISTGTGTLSLTSAGMRDALVIQLDSNGVALWAHRAGGPSEDEGLGVGVAADGSVYFSGVFRETAEFGTFTLATSVAAHQFLTRIAPSGSFEWARALDAYDGYDGTSNDVLVAANGDVILVGNALARYDSAGSPLWTTAPGERLTGTLHQEPGTGNDVLYVLGLSTGAIHEIDTGTGAETWQKATGVGGVALAVDSAKNFYIAGSWDGNATDFDPGPATFLQTSSWVDGYLLKLNSAGDFVSARRMGGEGPSDGPREVLVDAAGDVFLCGEWGGTADFDVGDATVVRTSPSSEGQGFVMKTTQGLGAISGRVSNDVNGNGTREATEPALAGATVYLDLNENGVRDAGEPSTTSAANGTYVLQHIVPGSYRLRHALPAGWTATHPAAAFYAVEVDTDEFLGDAGFSAQFPSQNFAYASVDVPKKFPNRTWQTAESRLTVNDSYPIFGLQVSISTTAPPLRLTLIGPDGTSIDVTDPASRTISVFNHKDVRGTWTLSIWNGDPNYAVSGSLTAWSITVLGARVPQIGTLSASPNPVNQGSTLTLTANNVIDRYPGGTISAVSFYRDSNANGVFDAGADLLVGTDVSSAGGWTFATGTSGLSLGTHVFFAQAQNNVGVLSTAVKSSVTVQKKGKASGSALSASLMETSDAESVHSDRIDRLHIAMAGQIDATEVNARPSALDEESVALAEADDSSSSSGLGLEGRLPKPPLHWMFVEEPPHALIDALFSRSANLIEGGGQAPPGR